MFTPLHPPAKLCYVPIVQHDVRWSAGVQRPYILPSYLCKINMFLFDILWSAGCCLTSRKNNKAVNGVVNLVERYLFIIKKCEGLSSLFYVYIYIYIFISIIVLFNDKFAGWTSVTFLNTDNELSSLN